MDRKDVHFFEGDILTYSQTFHRLVSNEFRRENIVPTKVLVAGSFKERCSVNAFDALKKAFPNAKLVFLRGDYNLSGAFKKSAQIAEYMAAAKPRSKLIRKAYGIKRSPLKRKLLR